MIKGTTSLVLHGQVWAKQNKWYATRAGARQRTSFISEVENESMNKIRLLNNFKTVAGWAKQSLSIYCFQIFTTLILLQILHDHPGGCLITTDAFDLSESNISNAIYTRGSC